MTQAALLKTYHPAHTCERAEYIVAGRYAQRTAVCIRVQRAQHPKCPFLLRRAQTVVQQITHHQPDGVDRPLRPGHMPAFSPRFNSHTAVFGPYCYVFRIRQAGLFCPHQRIGAVRHSQPLYPPFSAYPTGKRASGEKQNAGCG